ncbi:MAG: hypothetical protein Q9210_004374 [Variospora velana]
MALQILPYAVEHYNSLPGLRVAKDQFDSAKASEILFTEIGNAFVKHRIENTLGIVLLHNHFFLERYEMLVNYDSVAIPWDLTSGTTELMAVNASAWRFTDQGLAPYEFAYTALEVSLDRQPMQSFLLELAAILEKWNLTNILGICSLGEKSIDRPATMEFTSGRANITLPFDITPNDGNVIDATWQFSSNPSSSSVHAGPNCQGPKNGQRPMVFGQCKNRCKGKPHESRHTSNT